MPKGGYLFWSFKTSILFYAKRIHSPIKVLYINAK